VAKIDEVCFGMCMLLCKALSLSLSLKFLATGKVLVSFSGALSDLAEEVG
jgi:hypothetical protein